MRKQVVFGFLGTTLDQGKHPDRWQRWRPTVALCQHDDLQVDRFELLHSPKHAALAERIAGDIVQVSPETEVVSRLIQFKDPWDFEEVYAALHDFARGYPFDADVEDYLIHITTGTHVGQICWFLLAEARIIPGQILQVNPPKLWRNGGVGTYSIIDLDLSRYDKIATRFSVEKAEATAFLKSGIETRNTEFNAMIDRIEQVAIRSKAPILLTGSTGAGKSQLARRIFELKEARHQINGPFVEVNCATLRGDSAMSALFGHVKGAFTGAMSGRPGLLRAANSGILFLDEIGELGLDEQAMILRAIEEKRFLPVGSDKEVSSDFQLVAGTNRDLARAVGKGQFREDLLARLDLWSFALPGLSQRREDIEPNLDYELNRHARNTGDSVTFNKEARETYLAFAMSGEATWPASFRDLSASVTRMATLAPKGRIGVTIVEDEIARLTEKWRSAGAAADDQELLTLLGPENYAATDPFDLAQLAYVVRVCRTSRSMSDAGRRLFAASRQRKASANDSDRLKKYLARFGLSWGQFSN